MGWPVYSCSKLLATDWWRVVEVGGFKVEREAAEAGFAVTGTVIGLGATVVVVSRLETREAGSGVSYPSILMMGGGKKNERELLASLERTFLASGANLGHGKPFACRRLLRCPPMLARDWGQLLEDGLADIPLSRGPLGSAAPENAPIPYRCESIRRSGDTIRVFGGPAFDPLTGEITAYIAVDYPASRLHRSNGNAEALAEYITNLFITHGAHEVGCY